MRAVWVDEGNAPNYPLLRKHGVDQVFMSSRCDREGYGPALFDEIRAQGFGAGIYRGHGWDGDVTGKESAEIMNRQWLKFEGNKKLLRVQFNEEAKNPDLIVAFLARWRQLRPWVQTSWTMEGWQGGWVVAIRDQVIASRVLLVPQNYGGRMDGTDNWDSFGTVKDLLDYGFPLAQIRPFYDAARLARGWDGFAFTQNRLPA